jgi:single-strand DNA-binding protein
MSKKSREHVDVEGDPFEYCNQVLLVGRVSSPGVERELPSGDKVVEFRIVVQRDSSKGKRSRSVHPEGRTKSGKVKKDVDSLDIASWSASTRRSATSLQMDQWVEVNGSVRRRFWKTPGGVASRWQIEAHNISKL